MLLRPRDLSHVRPDSLRMATKKISEGCASCAESYLDLARRNGATEQEIVAARSSRATLNGAATGGEPGPVEPGNEISRRLFLKGLAGTGAGLGMWPRSTSIRAFINDEEAPAKIPIAHREKAGVGPFGVDSNTGPASGRLPINFYIGEMGYGECENNGPCFNGTRRGPCATRVTRGTACFNIATAHVATPSYTYGYWGLQGPGKNPGHGSAYDWGAAQGVAAVDAWLNGRYANLILGQTIFADVEPGFGGWMDPQVVPDAQALNGDVLNGYLDAIANQDQWDGTLKSGVYLNARDINGPNHHYFGPDFSPSQPFAFWMTGTFRGLSVCRPAVGGCAPCDPSCSSAGAVQFNWDRAISRACFAGQAPVLWQFWISSCGCAGDFNFSPQSAFQFFNPVACS